MILDVISDDKIKFVYNVTYITLTLKAIVIRKNFTIINVILLMTEVTSQVN